MKQQVRDELQEWIDDAVTWRVIPYMKPEKFEALCRKLAYQFCKRHSEELNFNYVTKMVRSYIEYRVKHSHYHRDFDDIKRIAQIAKRLAEKKGGDK